MEEHEVTALRPASGTAPGSKQGFVATGVRGQKFTERPVVIL